MPAETRKQDPTPPPTEAQRSKIEPSSGNPRVFSKHDGFLEYIEKFLIALQALHLYPLYENLRSNALRSWDTYRDRMKVAGPDIAATSATETNLRKLRDELIDQNLVCWYDFLALSYCVLDPIYEHIPMMQSIAFIWMSMRFTEWLIEIRFHPWYRWLVLFLIVCELTQYFLDESLVTERQRAHMLRSIDHVTYWTDNLIENFHKEKRLTPEEIKHFVKLGTDVKTSLLDLRTASVDGEEAQEVDEKIIDDETKKGKGENWGALSFLVLWHSTVLVAAIIITLFF